MIKTEIIQRLQHIEELQQVPVEQLSWWIDNAEFSWLQPGDFLFRPGEEANHLFVILEGRLEIFLTTNAGRQGQMELSAPTLTGVLPFSRMTHASGTGVALTPLSILAMHRDRFPDLVKDHYALTQGLVHFMTSRVRTFTRQTLQNEKMMALGKLSAGLAHELNNPSAAIVQSSRALKNLISKMPALLLQSLPQEWSSSLLEQLEVWWSAPTKRTVTLLERRAQQRDWEALLEDLGIQDYEERAEEFVESGLPFQTMEQLLQRLPTEFVESGIQSLAWVLTARQLTSDVQSSGQKISELVNSVKRFTHMDRGRQKERVDIHLGIQDSVRLLQHKWVRLGISVTGNFLEEGPKVEIYPGDMGQVWMNLLDNAADALEGQAEGLVEIRTESIGEKVIVRICDNGPGIPPEVLPRIFDPFFTTKVQGKGTGMGLETSVKVVEMHQGSIKVNSFPGQTVFTVELPS